MSAQATQDPMIGSLLDGRYQLIARLGRGGMGNVYLAEETRLRRRCALKVLHPHLTEDRTHVERFLREAQMIAQLEHPNIVDIYAYGEEPSGVVWFAMELLTGEDLDARSKGRVARPFSTHQCCLWGIQIAQAMTVVHQGGLIHRDLKTSNIFLATRKDGQEVVKLLDFGIARPEEGSELTATGVALGTPSYMSPEQVRNVVVDRRSDIYSFGVLLFKLVTDRLPFTGDAVQVALAQCTLPIPAPSSIGAARDISPELDALVLRATEKVPGDRFQTMREVEDALWSILQAEAPELMPSTTGGRMIGQTQISRATESTARLVPPADAQTASTAAQATGATSAVPVRGRGRASASMWLLAGAGAGVVGIALWWGMVGGDRKAEPAPVVAAAAAISPPPVNATPPVQVVVPPVPAVVTPEPVVANGGGAEPVPVSAPVTESVVKAVASEKPRPKPVAAPVDPLQQIERKAKACRRKHDAVDGPKITIDYAVGVNGKVTRSVPSTADELGKCLAAAVQGTQFEPKLVLSRRISL